MTAKNVPIIVSGNWKGELISFRVACYDDVEHAEEQCADAIPWQSR